MYPEDIREKFCELFPEATSYYSWSATGYLNRLDKIKEQLAKLTAQLERNTVMDENLDVQIVYP